MKVKGGQNFVQTPEGRSLKTYDEDLRDDESDLVSDTVLVDEHTVGDELDDEADDLRQKGGQEGKEFGRGEREEDEPA